MMKVLFHRYNSICEPDYIRAFQKLGLEVLEDRDEIGRKAISVKERVDTLARHILEERPLFVFTINFFPYISLICEKLRVLYVSVSVDCPVAEYYDVAIRSPFNRAFLFDRQQYLSIRNENPEHIYHLPLGVDVERIDETIGRFDPDTVDEKYAYDISFVGSLYREKDEYSQLNLPLEAKERMECLIKQQQPVPGLSIIEEELTDDDVEMIRAADPGFCSTKYSVRDISRSWAIDLYFGDHLTSLDREKLFPTLAEELPGNRVHLFTRSDTKGMGGVVCHGGVNSLTEMPEVFRRSRINLNPTMRSIRTGLPQRIWDVLGSGGFLLTNAQAEIPDFLQIGKHLDVYETTEELIEKAKYWLAHEEERKTIAEAGYEEVKTKHTILARVAEMIRIIVSGMEQ